MDDFMLVPEIEKDFPDEVDLSGDGGGSCEYRDLIGLSTDGREKGFSGDGLW